MGTSARAYNSAIPTLNELQIALRHTDRQWLEATYRTCSSNVWSDYRSSSGTGGQQSVPRRRLLELTGRLDESRRMMYPGPVIEPLLLKK